ncbi:MAG: hypothetical protein ACKVOJ_14150 [Sphingomonadaceae bacterium]
MTIATAQTIVSNSGNGEGRAHRTLFWMILIVAAVLRFIAALPESMHHTDEIGQYTDQAFRLVFGYSAVPWEYRFGMRSWLLPLLLSGPMALGHWIAPSTSLYLLLPKLCVGAASLSIPCSAYYLGRRLSPTHALIAMAVSGIWFESIFFGTHILSEPLAVAAILPAIAILSHPQASQKHLVIAGALLGIGLVLRFQYGPAIAILTIGYCWQSLRLRCLPVIFGGLLAAMASALIDMMMGATPFSWLMINIYQNIIVNRSAQYGVSPPAAYLGEMGAWWGVGMVLIAGLMVSSIQHHRTLIWAAIINVGLHSAIGHKEYRFIVLSITIFVIVAAISSVTFMQWLKPRLPANIARGLPMLLIATWAGLSASLAFSRDMSLRWTAYGAAQRSMHNVGKDASVCAVGIDAQLYWEYGSYGLLKRNIPIYPIHPKPERDGMYQLPGKGYAGYNIFIGNQAFRSRLPRSYIMSDCQLLMPKNRTLGDANQDIRICVFRRSGGCDGRGLEKFRINEILRASGN